MFLCLLLTFLWSSCFIIFFFFFKQKTAYEMRISDWSSDVCSSDLKFFPTAQLLGPISRDRTGPVEHPLVGPAKGFYRCANIIEEGEGALLKAPGSVLPDIAVMVANRGQIGRAHV